MPIAKFQLPDGRVARIEVPEGTSPEQASTKFGEFVASQQQIPQGQQLPQETTQPLPTADSEQGVGNRFGPVNEAVSDIGPDRS